MEIFISHITLWQQNFCYYLRYIDSNFLIFINAVETALGRKTGKSCIHAFGDLTKYTNGWIWSPIQYHSLLLPYSKWVSHERFFETATDNPAVLNGNGYWWNHITSKVAGIIDPSFWFFVFTILYILCVAFKIDKDIEKVRRFWHLLSSHLYKLSTSLSSQIFKEDWIFIYPDTSKRWFRNRYISLHETLGYV